MQFANATNLDRKSGGRPAIAFAIAGARPTSEQQ
jgi:hypothetical protein